MSELMEEEQQEEQQEEVVRKGLSTWCAIKISTADPISKELGKMIVKYLTNPNVTIRTRSIVALIEIKSVGHYDEQLQGLEHDLPQKEQAINDEYIRSMQEQHEKKYQSRSQKTKFKRLTPHGFELGELIVLQKPIPNQRKIQGICHLLRDELWEVLADDKVTFRHLDRAQRYGIMTIGLQPFLMMVEKKKHFEIRWKTSNVLNPMREVKPNNYPILI